MPRGRARHDRGLPEGLASGGPANDYEIVSGFFVAALLIVGAAAIVTWPLFG